MPENEELAAKDAKIAELEQCLQNLEGRIATRRETIAVQKAEVERLKGVIEVERLTLKSCLKAYDDAQASLTAADEVRRLMAVKMERIDHNVRTCLCESCLAIQWFDATRTQENEISVLEARRMALDTMSQADRRREDYNFSQQGASILEIDNNARCICPSCGRPHSFLAGEGGSGQATTRKENENV